MFSGLKIGNFKAFGPPQEIPLRPITLIFGPNSAGKSNIIQSLLLARHIQDTGNVDVHQTTLGGAAVDLGGFTRFVHNREATREIGFHVSIPRSELCGRFHDLDGFETLTLGYTFGLREGSVAITSITLLLDGRELRRLIRTADGSFAIEKTPIADANPLALHDYETESRQRFARLLVDGGFAAEVAANIEAKYPEVSLRRETDGSITVAALAEGVRDVDTCRQSTALGEELSAARFVLRGLMLSITNPLPRKAFYATDDSGPEEHDADENPREFFAHVSELSDDELHHNQAKYRFYELDSLPDDARLTAFEPAESPQSRAKAMRYAVECLLEAASRAVATSLAAVTYLGPLRWIPPRLIPDGEQFDASWRAGGGDAWQRLRREAKLRERVNHFLRHLLRTRYQLDAREFAVIKPATTFEEDSVLDSASARVAEDSLPIAPRGVEPARNADVGLTALTIVNAESGLAVSHRDVGTGVSQLLPVLVNAAGAKERLLAIEQPELHLHPALQAELGDVFIESALGENKNTLLIETHSEHLLLRIMRRMRNTAEGTLPKGAKPVTPNDVALLHVSPGAQGSVVQEIGLNESGELVKGWPGGFFEEGFEEMFS